MPPNKQVKKKKLCQYLEKQGFPSLSKLLNPRTPAETKQTKKCDCYNLYECIYCKKPINVRIQPWNFIFPNRMFHIGCHAPIETRQKQEGIIIQRKWLERLIEIGKLMAEDRTQWTDYLLGYLSTLENILKNND